MARLKAKVFLMCVVVCSALTLQSHKLHAYDTTIYTIPKSGTFFLGKYFSILCKRGYIPEESWHITHYYEKAFSPHFSKFANDPSEKVISLIRDPRDILVSLVTWLEKVKTYAYCDIEFTPQWFLLTMSQKVKLLADESLTKADLSEFYEWQCEDELLPQKIRKTAERALQFHALPQTLVVKFEEIIGERGRGDFDPQLNTFRKINEYCQIDIDELEFRDIVSSLWGTEDKEQIWQPTFYKGYIGRWKEELDDTTQECIKKYYSNLLAQLDYEA